ncbi:MAG TPA: hypothetical protein VFM93_00865 [Candidatus Limnocylindria bacterium]|nr:hypothetical protein [Candidatus Limnocylindria bacterium]
MALREDAPVHREPVRELRNELAAPARQAFLILRTGFTVLPIVMGADKFLHILTQDWTKYLWPGIPRMTGIDAGVIMVAVGVVEILAGILVAISPCHFAWLVAAWLALIVGNLLLLGGFLDVAMRDVGLIVGAIALALLARAVHEREA